MLIFVQIHINESSFWQKFEPRKKLTRFAWSKPLQKCGTGETLVIYHNFHGLNYHIFF